MILESKGTVLILNVMLLTSPDIFILHSHFCKAETHRLGKQHYSGVVHIQHASDSEPRSFRTLLPLTVTVNPLWWELHLSNCLRQMLKFFLTATLFSNYFLSLIVSGHWKEQIYLLYLIGYLRGKEKRKENIPEIMLAQLYRQNSTNTSWFWWKLSILIISPSE